MNARAGASSQPAMHKDDNYETSVGPVVAKLRVNHDAAEITARLQDRTGESVVRATVERSTRPALGASLRLASETDTDMVRAGVYFGRMRLTVGARGKGLRALLGAVGVKRRLLSVEVYRWDDEGVVSGATIVQAHLWSPDEGSDQRHVWLNVTDKLWGRRQHEDRVLEEREVLVRMPEAAYPCTARLVERTTTRPRSPFQRFARFVELFDCAAVVPMRKSDSYAHIDYGRIGVEAQTIEQGIGVVTGRILHDRRQYGGARWANGVPPREKWLDSHKVSLTSVDRIGGEMAKGYRGQSFESHLDLEHNTGAGPVVLQATGAFFKRDSETGGLLARAAGAASFPHFVERRGELVPNPSRGWLRVFPGDVIRVDGAAYVVYFSPIGPPPEPVTVNGTGDITHIKGTPLAQVGRTIAEEFGLVEQDVAAAVQDLAAHPPEVSPSEEAEGAAVREYAENGPTEKLVAVESGEELAKQMADYRLIDLVK